MADARTIDSRFTPVVRLSSVRFTTFTAEEIKKMSCKRITNPNTFDTLLHPSAGGLYDPALGPTDKQELCGTCGLNYIHCPGHVGHIILPLPVFHPIFFQSLYRILRGSCFVCHRFSGTNYKSQVLKGQISLLDKGLVSNALELESVVSANVSAAGNKESIEQSIVESVSTYVETCLQKLEAEGSVSRLEKSKHLTDLRQLFINDFFRSLSTTKCPHCNAPVRKIRHEYQSKVMLRGLSLKQSSVWKAAMNKQKMQETLKELEEEEELVAKQQIMDKCTEQYYLTPLEARNHLRSLWTNDPLLMMTIFSCLRSDEGSSLWKEGSSVEGCPADMFFIDVIAVPPSRFRPISSMGAKKFENSQTTNLQRVLKMCEDIQDILKQKQNPEIDTDPEGKQTKMTLMERLQATWINLQVNVNGFMDSDINKKIKDAPNGIKQILEKKEGLFRKHMMGKRVNYAARSVISPDPNINMDQIGIPMVFASRLTYPQPVTHWNVHELRQAVINGPNKHPGATHVQNEDGSLILLKNLCHRQGIAKRLLAPNKIGSSNGATKKVFRHLKNGDVLLLNRQPTLHKPSIMAMKARVLPGEKTLRLHYANCKSFNADFDGDEMNAHFPQNELARSEAYNIVLTHHQYLVPKDGTPLSGLIQDHVVSGLLMTLRGRMFPWSDYQQLLFAAIPNYTGYFKLLPPCIMKPQRLWSGKQVISTLLLNIVPEDQDRLNLISKAKINPKEWGRKCKGKKRSQYKDDIMTESEVIFRDGHLLCGVLDKSQFGASQYGFVHSCHELYGGSVANLLISALGRIFTMFLQLCGFTLGVEDILVTIQADKERKEIIKNGRRCGNEAAAEAFGVKDSCDINLIQKKYEDVHHSLEDNGLKVLDFCVKKRTDHYNNLINTSCVPAGLMKPFPHNSLQLMVQSGAKGSTVNCMQISCLLGQIELEGRRPPIMLSGKSLPSFLPYDTSPRAGGFVDGRFLTGIRPQEYFFHCMAGREGLIDTAVKTSRSGYLQRCLIKHLEGICVQYDMTVREGEVRDSDGSIIQFQYGEDGLDIGKTRFLTPKQMHFLSDNYRAILYQLDPQSALESLESTKAVKYQKKVDRWKRKQRMSGLIPKPRRSGFLNFYEQHIPEVKAQLVNDRPHPEFNYRTSSERKIIDMWYSSSPMYRHSMNSKHTKSYDPVLSVLRGDRYFGSIPEKINDHINEFLFSNPDLDEKSDREDSLTADKLKTLVQFKCLRALCDPGEAVGLLAAQSVGEPSTQMTLNTFHFAGRGEMNVTLGIPRLREILMTASPNIKTPSMDVPLLPVHGAKEKGERLKKLFTSVLLGDVLDQVEVWENMSKEGKGFRHRLYHIKMTFLEHKYYKDQYVITPSLILNFVETVFIKKLTAAINKEIKGIRDKRLKSIGVVNDKESGPHLSAALRFNEEEDTRPNPADEGDDVDTDVSDLDEQEPDAGNDKLKRKKKQQISYESPDEDEDTLQKEKSDDDDSMMSSSDEETATVKKKKKNDDSEDEDVLRGGGMPKPAKNIIGMDQQRIQSVLSLSSHAVNYIYDSEDELWCQVSVKFPCVDCKVMVGSLIEKLSKKIIVYEVPHIKKGFLTESQVPGEQGVWRLKTEGVNMQELWKHENILDLKKAYTNNIHSIANTFGIEAASKAIIREISGVFRVYGIAVDYRHLSLIADHMTFDGHYKPFNRYGMEANSSPFQQMSFETTMKFLKTAAIQGDVDTLQSPSARIVAGRVVNGGTGCIELRQKLCLNDV